MSKITTTEAIEENVEQTTEDIEVNITVGDLSGNILVTREAIKIFGSVEAFAEAVRNRSKGVLEKFGADEKYEGMWGKGFFEGQAALTLKEKPLDLKYEDYEKWCIEHGLAALDEANFNVDSEIMKRYRHIVEKKFKIGLTITQKDGNLSTGRFVIKGFNEKGEMILGKARGAKNIAGYKNPLKYKLVPFNHNKRND